jgi:hypothetical protein
VDARLCRLVVGAFKACNQDFWTKIEGQIKIGTDSQQVIGKSIQLKRTKNTSKCYFLFVSDIPNSSQIVNTNLANLIFYHEESVRKMIESMGVTFAKSEPAETIISHLQTGKNLILIILQQLFGKRE